MSQHKEVLHGYRQSKAPASAVVMRVLLFMILVYLCVSLMTMTAWFSEHGKKIWLALMPSQQMLLGEESTKQGLVCEGEERNLSEVAFSGKGLHGIDFQHEFELDREWEVPPFISNVSPEFIKDAALPRGNGSAVIMLAMGTENQIDFLENWILNVKRAGIVMAVIGAGDNATFNKAREYEVSVFRWSPEEHDASAGWGTSLWTRNTWQKVFAVQKIVSWGYDVILSDLDVVWWRDPSIIFDKHPQADMFFSHDGVATSNTEEDAAVTLLEKGASIHNFINTGMYMARSTGASRAFMRRWAARYPHFDGHDQNGIYDLIKSGPEGEKHPEDPAILRSANNTLYHAVLPTYVFANGHSYFVSKLHSLLNAEIPFGMHATWTYENAAGKRSRLREVKAWHDPHEYYDGKFITMDLEIPSMPLEHNEKDNTEDMLQFHLMALEMQMKQVAIGMMFSLITGRSFIMPNLQCFCERIWYSVIKCRFPDYLDMKFPTPCPMDYYFHMDMLYKGDRGVKIDFREQGFLDNPNVSPQIKTSVASISLSSKAANCAMCLGKAHEDTRTCLARQQCISSGEIPSVMMPGNLTDVEIHKYLAPMNDTKLWVLNLKGFTGSTMTEAFGGFESPQTGVLVRSFFTDLLQDWCCRTPDDAKRMNKSMSEPLNILPGFV
ncbi:Arabinosyltransferase XEG113 [Picochlorum sp. SENEW3]|nr:Arabinosyltransferase XEG113 [Picochlorum sp. SENEW3]WPT14726.1 Arabinosyltransferase XEG113 [Picochlorum sp. SENEW3]